MAHSESGARITRRKFTQYLMMLGIGGQALLQTRSLRAAIVEAQDTVNPTPWPQMSYRTLGRTGFKASRLIYGCGAALSRSPADRLLNIALEAGVNVYDVGSSRYYDDAEKNLSPFIKKHRDDIFLISKSMTYLDADAD
ncbi:MAG: hypothetical protein O7H39_05265, partial [Gammaproteobacteria bacterium]|nr:hypothetical protein [Gammaproteobacteria bacterium]